MARDPNSPIAFYERQNRFQGLAQAEQVLRVAWFLHEIRRLDRFQPKDISDFFGSLQLTPPNVHVNIKRLHERRPKALLWDKRGYYMEGNCRRNLSDQLKAKVDLVTHVTSQSLRDISAKISEQSQRTFLAETINCYRVGAFRATIIMAWNLAFDHFQNWLSQENSRLTAFNGSLQIKYPKKNLSISRTDDFGQLKEFEIIEVAQHASMISKNVADIMKEKLKRRNAAAHPSGVVFTQAQADDTITDLVHNVIARLG